MEKAGTATLSNVATNVASVSLLAADDDRLGVIIFNDATTLLMVKFGATASATSFTHKIAAGGSWVVPEPLFTGAIDGIWSGADAAGAARITVLT